ncbi:hypothetical protein SOVF_051690 [Spinacia oleracea]|nr:hypothetical protein SOVF_051690 [Spinacia oleracea]
MQANKYGLQIRVPKSQQKQQQARTLVPKPSAFNDDDDDDVEREISRQAAKKKSNKEVEDQYKKALEEDPSVFDYDGVYDDMKSKMVQPKAEDRQQRQPKYIQALMEKAKKREREHEVVYERKLAKERNKEDHLYADKDKFVTGAYKRKLAEQEKWMEEERLRELREEKDNVTKKSDLADFYFNLSKNVAFGAEEKSKKSSREDKEPAPSREEFKQPGNPEKETDLNERVVGHPSPSSAVVSPSRLDDRVKGEAAAVAPEVRQDPSANPAPNPPANPAPNPQLVDQPKQDHHKKSQEALAAAKERFLARKKAKMDY